MPTCSSCGAGVDTDDKFCQQCGDELGAEPVGVDRVACESCGEPINADASTCPQCSDKKWTLDRTLLYLVAIMPIVSVPVGFVLGAMVQSANPALGDLTSFYVLGLVYLAGAAMTWGKYRQYRAHRQDG
jgi:RNA polymerase subunit RPABC4/transcription elongation factor Spt4